MKINQVWLGHVSNIDLKSAEAMWNFLTSHKDRFKLYLQEIGISTNMDPSNVATLRPKFHLVNYMENNIAVAEVRFESYEVVEMLLSGKKKTHSFKLPLQTVQSAKITYEKARQKYREILYASGVIIP